MTEWIGDAPSVIDIDPFAETTLRHPHSFDSAALAAGPVIFLPRYNLWALARHDLVKATFSDWRRFSSAAGTGLTHIRKAGNWRKPSLILEADPPDHARFRKIMANVLTGATLRQIRSLFAAEADKLVTDLVASGKFDAIKSLAEAFPLLVVPTMLGLPTDKRELMLTYSELNFNSMGPDNFLLQASRLRAAPITEEVMRLCLRENLAPGMLGERIYVECAAADIPEEDAATLVRTFFSASMDTTMNGIGFAIQALAERPDQWRLLRENPSLTKAAFDESLRHQSPSPYIGRTTLVDVEIDGVVIPADSKVLLLVGAANRDPRAYPDPDKFDLQRKGPGHVAFGVGIHACIGQLVAKLEAELVLDALVRHVSSIHPGGEPTYQMNNWLRGLASYPVEVEPA